jgi:hypothetical protein
MNADLIRDMEESIKLLNDSKYMNSIVPEIDNNASTTNNEEWLQEIEYSVKTYHLEQDISDEF